MKRKRRTAIIQYSNTKSSLTEKLNRSSKVLLVDLYINTLCDMFDTIYLGFNFFLIPSPNVF